MFFLPLVNGQRPNANSLVNTNVGSGSWITPTPGQPSHKGEPGTFEVIGNSLVSAQQTFLGTPDKVYILDKVENNAAQVGGHPAWGSEWTLSGGQQRAMDVITNSFCAGGNVLGNGTWLSIGGNQAVTVGGAAAEAQDGTTGPYMDADGRRSVRMLTPCDDNSCQWTLSSLKIEERWYPTIETLEDGSVIILGGCKWGGFVNDASQTNPTYEFFPPRGSSITSPILQNTLPANLYPLVWLLPSSKLLIQSNWATSLVDYKTHIEEPLDNIPDAVRTYPASGGSVMLPLTQASNWKATILFCGGSNIASDQWTSPDFVVVAQPASQSCVRITPELSKSYVQDDPLPERRSMATLVLLPDGKVLCVNGARQGTAGYGNNSWAVGQSYADDPVLAPVIYDPSAPAGSRWSSAGLSPSSIPRMYHSTALLLPDGSVLISGSNPNPDYTTPDQARYATEYRTERFYPPYYKRRRPQPKGLVAKLSYGGPPFDVSLDADDLNGTVNTVVNASVILLRPGYSTHAMNMGQRMLVLSSTYSGYSNNTATLHVSQVPPNAALFAPGPALLFVVVNGVPSVGVQVMVGSGNLETQAMLPIGSAPPSSIAKNEGVDKSNTEPTNKAKSGGSRRIQRGREGGLFEWIAAWIGVLAILYAIQ